MDLSSDFATDGTLEPLDEVEDLQENLTAEIDELTSVEPIDSLVEDIEINSDGEKFEFKYTPSSSVDNIDVDFLVENILNLNKKYPDLKILKVYELKYKNKYTLEQVSSELNMTIEQVVDALDKLVALI